jgi:molybdopterin-guanine dinucleotide biosynthesis protein A
VTSEPDIDTGTVGGIVLTGGTAARLDGADKAGLEVGGRTLLEHALAALAGVGEVVVVGPEVPTSRPVTFRREDPPGGGPAAAVAAGLSGFARRTGVVVVLAVDMPRVTGATVARLLAAASPGSDGAVLVDAAGRVQPLCAAYRTEALARALPESAEGLSMRRLVAPLSLVEVPAHGAEADDVDTWEDVLRLRGGTVP